MIARNETIFKWSLYAAATALCILLQSFLLQRVVLWGVIPFLYPVLAAVVASYEGSVSGSVYALALGVVCDWLLAGPLPCFYTLVFPLVSLCAALIAQGLLSAGLLCSLVVSAVAFLLVDSFHCVLLWLQGQGAWVAGVQLMGRELLVTALFVPPVSLLFHAIYRKNHRDE